MKILVTGSTGFIGNKLINELDNKNYNFVNLSKKKNQKKLKGYSNIFIEKKFENIKKKIFNSKIDTVIHLATNFKKKQSINLIPKIIKDNIIFGSQLLEILDKKKLKLFININTNHTSVNGKDFDPRDFYSSTKKSFENILFWYSKEYRFKVINLHLSDTYGPKDKRSKILDLMLRSLKKDNILKINKPHQEINYTYIDDVCDAIIALLKNKSKHRWQNYNLFSNETLTLIQLKKKIEKLFDKKSKIKFKRTKKRLIDLKFKPRYRLLKNWTQKTNLNKGILKINKYLI